MATTGTPGITVLTDGRRFIDKRYLGVRIGVRVGAVTQEQAEQRLSVEIARVGYELTRKAHARPTFSDCAMRYVAQSQGKRSIDVIKLHVRMLESYVGKLQPRQIHHLRPGQRNRSPLHRRSSSHRQARRHTFRRQPPENAVRKNHAAAAAVHCTR